MEKFYQFIGHRENIFKLVFEYRYETPYIPYKLDCLTRYVFSQRPLRSHVRLLLEIGWHVVWYDGSKDSKF